MITAARRFNHHNPLAAAWFLVPVVLILVPALLFSSFVPGWAPGVALVGLLAVFLLRSVATGRVIGHTPADWPLLPLLLTLPIGLWVTADPEVSLPRAYAFVANLALFWAVAAQRDAPWLRRSGWLLLLAGLVLGGIILMGTNFGRSKLLFIDQTVYGNLPDRWHAFWDQESFNANISAGLLALFWAPAVVLAWRGDSWQQRDVAKLVAVVLSALILLTQSRGALLGCIAALLVITVVQSRRWLPFWLIVLLFIAFLTLTVGPDVMLETILRRSSVVAGDLKLHPRQEVWQQSVHLIQDYPLTGVGLGMVGPAIIERSYPVSSVRSDRLHAHNIFLQVGAEMGLPGLLGHLAIYLALLYLLLRRALDRNAGYNQALALGLLGSLIIFLTHGLVDAIISSPQVTIVVWALLGLMAAVVRAEDQFTSTFP
jgi:putative inorganic carbon (HCO3(-)) transporter